MLFRNTLLTKTGLGARLYQAAVLSSSNGPTTISAFSKQPPTVRLLGAVSFFSTHQQPTAWNTKIVCTLGPSSIDKLDELVVAGMDVCRLNFSHGTHDEHKATFDKVRAISQKYDNRLAILCDIQGPKIRTGKMVEPFEILVGDRIRVTSETIMGTPERIQISYATLLEDLDKGDIIYINDGTVKLAVESKDDNDLICVCEAAGKISDNKGCNMPSGNLSVNVITEKDAKDLKFIAELDPEYVACSFVGTGDDLRQIRKHLADAGNSNIKLISKLERPVAVENVDDIIAESDAVMVARGDLGVEIDCWDVPIVQKEVIRKCNKESKPVIVATQMLDSMIENARPTRAEASDVFNAVVDGADAVMLSGETSVGKYPVETVKVMDEIVHVAQDFIPKHDPQEFHSSTVSIAENVCMAVHAFAEEFRNENEDYAGKIIVLTDSGFAARSMAKYRPSLPILAFSNNIRTVRELALCWGVEARLMDIEMGINPEAAGIEAVKTALDMGFLRKEDQKVVVLMPASNALAGYMCAVFNIDELKSQ